MVTMAQALTTMHTTLIPTTTAKCSKADTRTPPPCLDLRTSPPCQKAALVIQRRNIISLGITSAVWGLNLGENNNAWAAARRPPPQPTDEEKKDPNMSGVQAKVLASKKRKEAMRQAMEKQRERGKKIEQ